MHHCYCSNKPSRHGRLRCSGADRLRLADASLVLILNVLEALDEQSFHWRSQSKCFQAVKGTKCPKILQVGTSSFFLSDSWVALVLNVWAQEVSLA